MIVTFGCAAVNSSAIVCQSALPGSLLSMCHQSIVTGSAAAEAGADAAGWDAGAADDGAGVLPPPEQAAKASDAVEIRTAIR